MNARHFTASALLLTGLLLLTGCAAPVEVVPSASAVAGTPTEPAATEAGEPSATAPDLGDVSTWIAGSAGIGPITRGTSWAEVQTQLVGADSASICPSALRVTAGGSATIFVGVEADGDTIRQVWATSGAGGVSPSTAAGIVLGASLEDLIAAYPGIEESPTPYPTAVKAYAVADADGSWLVFSLRDDVITQVGASELPFPPKELCG